MEILDEKARLTFTLHVPQRKYFSLSFVVGVILIGMVIFI